MNDTKHLEDLKKRSIDLHSKGYNCAQSVLLCFSEELGLDEDTAAAITMGMGAGMGGAGEICGVASAMAAAAARILEKENGKKPEKAEVYALVKELLTDFKNSNEGRIRCPELKAPGAVRNCSELICQGVEILHNRLHR